MKTVLSRFLLIIALVLISLTAHAVSVDFDGTNYTVTQNNLQFVTTGDGRMEIHNGSEHVARIGLVLKGTANSNPQFLVSWNVNWDWEILSNTDENVSLKGTATFGGASWEEHWFFSNTEQKFSHKITNNSAFDITNLGLYYVVDTIDGTVDCITYTPTNGNPQNYCFETTINQSGDFSGYQKRIRFNDTTLDFQDLTDSGFTWNFLFAGNLNDLHANLPVTNGMVLGFTDFDSVLESGESVLLDPTVIDSSASSITNYGNAVVRDSEGNLFVVFEKVATPTNTDIFVSKSDDDGVTWTTFNLTSTTDFNESLPHIDINSTDGLIVSFDKGFADSGHVQVFVTTCSAGGCDTAGEFLTDLNVSECVSGTRCANSNIVVDVNDTAHLVYAKNSGVIQYRSNSGFAGGTWGAEEIGINVGGSSITLRDGIGLAVSKNGSGRKLVYTAANNSQANVIFNDGTNWMASPEIGQGIGGIKVGSANVIDNLAGFAGYDGNFYISYAQFAAGSGGAKALHFRQCNIDANCADPAVWSGDLNIMGLEFDRAEVSIFQTFDLNVNVIASPNVEDLDVNITYIVRLPDGTFTNSHLIDSNIMVSDSNRTYNPLFRNREYVGNFLSPDATLLGDLTLDFVYLTSNASNGNPSVLVFDFNSLGVANGIIANFTVTPPSPLTLDPESGVTNTSADFNSTSTELGLLDVNYLWHRDGEEITTDQNVVMDFNGPDADFNISLIVNGNDGVTHFRSQNDQNILLRQNAQGIDINFVFNAESEFMDVNYGVTDENGTTTINFAVWGFPTDNNLLGLVINQQYRVGDLREVCVVVNTTGDVNKLHCETFVNTHILTKIPKNISNLSLVTPFDVSIDSIPTQSFSGVSADQNFWFFYQSDLDTNIHNVIVDANVEFFLSTYFIGLNSTDLNQVIQPYVVPAVDGINVIITALDSLTNDPVPGVILKFNRNVSTDGDVQVSSGSTDDLGRLALAFIAGIDHNFSVEFPFGTLLKSGTYVPQTIDATNGITVSVPSTNPFDVNAIGVTDINFLQSQVDPQSPIDINVVIVSSSRAITSASVTIDHNGVQLDFNSVPTIPSLPFPFNFSIDVAGLDERIPLIVTVDINYTDGGTFQVTKAVTISRTAFDLFQSFTTAKTNDLGEIGGTMFLAALLIAIITGLFHYGFPNIDNSFTFVIAATILLFLSFVGWVDGVTWVIASIGGGALYFLRRVDK